MKQPLPYINLISGPRNISTALMYSFAQRNDLKVVDEPYYAYYLLKSGKEHPGQAETLASQPHEIEGIEKQLKKQAKESGLFVKNMAHHMAYVPMDYLSAFQQVFLIRDPKALISSFAQVIPGPDMQDIGLATELALFEQLSESKEKEEELIVLDSEEILKNPEKVLKQLCQRLEIDWDEKMLTWTAGARPEDGSWAKYWYENVHKSTGFNQQQKKQRLLPRHCEALYAEARPIYEQLFEKALKA